jgi:polysaccharide deacetylase family protein (PEP-CTERM system associated)
MPDIANALTVDVEDYFQVSALAPHIARAHWDRIPCRVERNVERILELLAEASARATFFTLGWIAERHPELVRRIAAAGHEVASHGYGHLRIHEQTPSEFAQDIRRAKSLLEDLVGAEVKGYRAPSFSIGAKTLWAFDEIAKAGYKYSSSVYPVRHDLYGMPDAPRFPYRPRADLIEIPVSTAPVLNRNLPAGGGGYFRLLPYSVSRGLIRRVNTLDRRPAVFYFHPWEIDAAQPRVPGTSFKTRFRHYVNLHRTEPRLRRLVRDFRWRRMDEVFLPAPDAYIATDAAQSIVSRPLDSWTAARKRMS